MPKGSPELTAIRKQEIIDACERLYKTNSFVDITIKQISSETSFTRTSIYNYFHTKEEIFLALYEREYILWNKQLLEILNNNKKLSKKELADNIASSLAKREQLLKLLSMNNYDMEANSRIEFLTSFKVAYGESMDNMRKILNKFCVKMTSDDIERFIYAFFPFMFGIYPYSYVTDKQKKAMSNAKTKFIKHSIYDLTYEFVLKNLTV